MRKTPEEKDNIKMLIVLFWPFWVPALLLLLWIFI